MAKCAYQTWPIDRLKQHPQQAANFHPLSEAELRALASDLEKNGQISRVEIAADGTMIDGHQRVEAAKLLHWSEIKVRVRHDLKTPEAIERRMLEANRARRQLDTLDQVRVAKRDLELQNKRESGTLDEPKKEALIRQLRASLGMSKKNVCRWLAVASAPMAIQIAVQRRRLTLVQGEQISRMAPAEQQRIAEAIDRGENPKALVSSLISSQRKAKGSNLNSAFSSFIRHVGARLDGLENGRGAIKRLYDIEFSVETILRLEKWIQSVKPTLMEQAKEFRQAMAEYEKSFPARLEESSASRA
jgi:ParB-like chromosome segregation protein Spo0J